jgi:oxygen-independent coproporphyrinogen-3 oxidase
MKINRDKFAKITGAPLDEMFGSEIYLAVKLGLIRKNGDTYKLTDRGAHYYHYIEQVYTTAYIDKMWNVSRKQAFPEQIILK